jgi:molybdopterin-guanine dinucleotide biosynthesis protein A
VNPVSVAILAGGKSLRMGQDKAFLPVGGRPCIERVLDEVRPLTDDLIVVANSLEPYRQWLGRPDIRRSDPRLVGDVFPGKGSLGGIYTALHSARRGHCLVVACDMPFLSRDLLRYLIGLASGSDVVVPVGEHGWETLHAVYGKACLEPFTRCLQAGQLRIRDGLAGVRVRLVGAPEVARFDPAFRSFLNMNTPADWEELQRLAGDVAEGKP